MKAISEEGRSRQGADWARRGRTSLPLRRKPSYCAPFYGAQLLGLAALLASGLFSSSSACGAEPLVRREYSEVHMGTDFRIVLYSADAEAANRAVAEAYSRVAALNRVMSDYDPMSELSLLSATAGGGKPQAISDDLWFVLDRAQRLAEASDGAFDVTVGPLTKMWRSARRTMAFPPEARMAEALAAVGFRNLRLDPAKKTAELLVPQMRLDLGGIAMGYAADEALKILKRHGLSRAMIDASGDIVCGDPPPEARGWKIGIAPLTESKGPPSRFIWLANGALTTSGDAFQFVEIDGVRYSHIVDPKTGRGLTNRSSVTVTAADCITADSLATAVSVLGPERGLKLIARTPGAAALIVVREGDETKTYASPNFDQPAK
jgi:FAD:protein FMN transferase